MAPRNQGRRRTSKEPTTGKNPGKKTLTKSSSPSLTLDEILTILNISFDKQLGILNGDHTHTPPPVAVLEQLRKTLVKLNDQLEIASEHDALNLAEIERRLDEDDEEEEPDQEQEQEEEEEEEKEDEEYSPDNYVNKSDILDQHASVPLKVIDSSDSGIVEDEVDDKNEEENINENENKDEDDNYSKTNDDPKTDPKDDKIDEDGDVIIKDEDEKKHVDSEKDPKQRDSSRDSAVLVSEDELEESKDEFKDAVDDNDVISSSPTKKRKLSVAQIENDPSVKNPKSEFVTSQTLPAAAQALGLFNEEDGSLQTHGEEYLKKKYAVASYPTTDLKSKLPGEIPDIDFSKNKPSNQVQFATFQSFIENFYRNFTEEDLKYFKNKFIVPDSLLNDSTYDPNLTPYLIPKLGPLYSTIWNEEENSTNYSPPPNIVTKESIIPKSSSNELNDDNLETEQVSCGPLVSRLLSAIIREDNGEQSADIDEDGDPKQSTTALPEQQGWKVSSVSTDYTDLEERLKRELKYIGIFMNLNEENNEDDQEPDWLNPEDDEVSTELRRLQSELKAVSKRNNKAKKILQPIIENQLAWQEYLSILDDLDKQVDQAYLKKIRVPKNKKKKNPQNITPSIQAQLNSQSAQQIAANSAIKSLLEKRARWINRIGPLFDKDNGETMKRYPKESIFDEVDVEDDEDDNDYEDGEELGLAEQ